MRRRPATRGAWKLVHFTPLRYPGGKGKLAPFLKDLLRANGLLDGDYVEPYAGGAAIGLELLQQDYVSRIHINDISRPIHAFWKSVLHETDEMARRVRNASLSVTTWDRQKRIFVHQDDHDDVAVGFAAFYLNRTNRSGIFNAGIIGGRSQTGRWKIDARYNGPELAARIESIGRFRDRISLHCEDAVQYLKRHLPTLPERTLIYLDPPYYVKGKELYYDYYDADDHAAIASLVTRSIHRQKWIVSYDNVAPIRALYARCPGIAYGLGYSAREARSGSEVMFFGPGLVAPPLAGAMRVVRGGQRPRVPALRERDVSTTPAKDRARQLQTCAEAASPKAASRSGAGRVTAQGARRST